MSEISREEIIKWLTQRENCSNVIPQECLSIDCEDCPNNYDGSKETEIMKAIISDMEKLQKIEEIVNRDKGCFGCFGNCYGCGNDRYPEIEKIVRGEE